jgi:hypothetical protein
MTPSGDAFIQRDPHGHQDASEFPVEISLSPVDTENRTLVTAAVRDSTERLRLEEIRREMVDSTLEREALARHTDPGPATPTPP